MRTRLFAVITYIRDNNRIHKRNMKYVLATLAFGLCTLHSVCQSTESSKGNYISFGYFGDHIFHPGFNIGLQRHLNRSDSKQNGFDYGLCATGYIHFKNNIGLQLKPQIAYYQTIKKRFTLGLKAELGYNRRFYQGKTYQVEDGVLVNVPLAGQNAVLYGGYIHFGKNMFYDSDKNLNWFAEMGGFWEFPYNQYSLFHPAITIGVNKTINK